MTSPRSPENTLLLPAENGNSFLNDIPSSLWGEIVQESDPPRCSVDPKKYIGCKVTDVYILPVPHHSSNSSESSTRLNPDEYQMDPVVLHTIQLLKYSKRLRLLLSSHRPIDILEPIDAPTEIPPSPARQLTSVRMPFNKVYKNIDSDFVQGNGHKPAEIDKQTCQLLLKKSVATLCAHIGYDSCSCSTLDTLINIASQYLTTMTKLLRQAFNEHGYSDVAGSTHPVERVFLTMDIGRPTVLHQFYQDRVLMYHKKMNRMCSQLYQEYEKLRTSDNYMIAPYSHMIRTSVHSSHRGSDDDPPFIPNPDGGDADQLMMEDLGLDVIDSTVLMSEEDRRLQCSVITDTSQPSVSSDFGSEPGDDISVDHDLNSSVGHFQPARKKRRR